MPVYDFQCGECDTKEEIFLRVDKINQKQYCKCGQHLTRLITPFGRHQSWSGTYSGYFDRGLGCYIDDYHHREKVMRKLGVRPLEAKEHSDEKLDAVMNETAAHNKRVEKFTQTGEI